MRLLVATHNPGKLREMKSLLERLPLELVSLDDLGIGDDFPEDGDTFEANALGKAQFYHQLSRLPTVADDSGIFVEALKNELGVKTRRWGAGAEATDEVWLDFFMKRMKGVADRRASFLCCIAYADEKRGEIFLGKTQGVITEELGAPVKPGIPLSSVFLPEGCASVYAALSEDEKNRISHRGKALHQLLKFLSHA